MQSENHIAFKEWAVVCAALAQGRQSLILRKGGIHEGRAGFRIEHGEFWLFSTGFHQQREEIVRDAWPLLEQVDFDAKHDCVAIRLYAVVHEAHRLQDPDIVARLSGQHIWSPETVEKRFHYRSPGLFALFVRVYGRTTPVEITLTDRMAGCKSWVDLPSSLSTAGLLPVLNDPEFERQRAAIVAALC